MPRLVFLLLALAACLTFAVASALPPRTLATGHGTAIEWSNVDKTTNAERLAAGLLPKKPRMLHEPSRPRQLRPRASSKPLNGRYLAITKPNSQTIMGYGAVTFVAGGILQVIDVSDADTKADTFYAPSSLPSFAGRIAADSRDYGNGYVFALVGPAGPFSIGMPSSDYQAYYDIADVESVPGRVEISYATQSTGWRMTIRIYMQSNGSRRMYGGGEAQAVNEAYGLTGTDAVTEEDEVWFYLTDASGNLVFGS